MVCMGETWDRREVGVETVQTNVRLPRELHEWLRRDAFERKISQSLIVEEALVKLREAG